MFDTYFFKCLNRTKHSDAVNVSNMISHLQTRGLSLFLTTTEAVIPVHINNNHWILAVVNCRVHVVYLLDPYQRQSQTHRNVSNLLVMLFSRIVSNGSTASWTVETVIPNLPKQTDGTSCGVFVSFYAYFWINYRRFPTTQDFVQETVPHLRLFMASRLLSFARGGLSTHLERSNLRPDMNDLPLSFRSLFLDIPWRSLNHWSRAAPGPGSPLASLRLRPVSPPGVMTESPIGKIAKLSHTRKVASPGTKSATILPTPSHYLSRPRPVSSPGGITESPLAKIAKVPHAGKPVASPGNKSATPSHYLSPSKDASESNNSRRDDKNIPVRRLLDFTNNVLGSGL